MPGLRGSLSLLRSAAMFAACRGEACKSPVIKAEAMSFPFDCESPFLFCSLPLGSISSWKCRHGPRCLITRSSDGFGLWSSQWVEYVSWGDHSWLPPAPSSRLWDNYGDKTWLGGPYWFFGKCWSLWGWWCAMDDCGQRHQSLRNVPIVEPSRWKHSWALSDLDQPPKAQQDGWAKFQDVLGRGSPSDPRDKWNRNCSHCWKFAGLQFARLLHHLQTPMLQNQRQMWWCWP